MTITMNYSKVATVASGATTSNPVELSDNEQICGFFLPSTFDGTTFSLTASTEFNGTYVDVEDASGATYTFTTSGASKYIPVENLAIIAGLKYVKVVCGTSQSTSSTAITLALRLV